VRVWVLLFSLVVCASLAAQTEQTLRISKFKGLNTVDVVPDVSEATIAHNIDLSRSGVGTIAKRYGYEMVDSLTVVDSIVGLYALQFDDGSKYMMVIGVDADSGWGRIYVSNEGSENFEDDSLTQLYSRFPITEDIFVSKLRDQYYITTSVARGVVLGRIGESWSVRPFPMVGPGEPMIVPIPTTDTVFRLNGTYRYAFAYTRTGWDSAYGVSVLTAPVKVQDGRVYMAEFPWMPLDTSSTNDSLWLIIFRSRGDIGTLDPSDTVFYVGTQLHPADDSGLAAMTFIDSIPDDSLSTTYTIQAMDERIMGFDENDTLNLVKRRYGAPGLVARDSFIVDDTMYDGSKIGPYWGWTYPIDSGTTADAEGIKASGVSYVCTFIDTITNIESEAGGAFAMIHDTTSRIRSYKLSIPRPSIGWGNMAVNLYRAKIMRMTHGVTSSSLERGWGWAKWVVREWVNDSIGWDWVETSRTFANEYEYQVLVGRYGRATYGPYWNWTTRWESRTIVDTIYLEPYKLLAQISDTSTTYTDSLRTDSLYSHDVYQQKNVPPFLSSTFAYNGRLYGTYGSYLYRSEGADAGTWGLFDRVDINPGSDAIMAAWPGQFALRIAEQFSNYNVTVDGFSEPEIVGRWGCLAPKSLAFCPAGPLYLSAGGVVLERDGEYLERTIVPGIISDKIGNFSYKSPTELKAARGLWLPREQQYWLHIGDTTWVWDWIATQRLGQNVWTTSSIAFAGGTLYDQADDFEVVAGRSLYFWNDGDPRIYRYGKGIADDENDPYSAIGIDWKSGPFLWNAEKSQLSAVNMFVSADESVPDSTEAIIVFLSDQLDDTVAESYFWTLDDRYMKNEISCQPSLYYRFQLYSADNTIYALQSGTAIQMIEFYYIPDAERVPFTH
jgi:hypothetical protein